MLFTDALHRIKHVRIITCIHREKKIYYVLNLGSKVIINLAPGEVMSSKIFSVNLVLNLTSQISSCSSYTCLKIPLPPVSPCRNSFSNLILHISNLNNTPQITLSIRSQNKEKKRHACELPVSPALNIKYPRGMFV